MVDGETRSVTGIAAQAIYYRPIRKRKKQNSSQALKRKDRESRVWGEVIDEIGPASNNAQYVYVCDRGADNFEVFCHLVETDSDWIVRAKKQKRNLLMPDDETV